MDDALLGTSSPPLLTEEEETALLAEYGAEVPYDALLDVAAPSLFRSEYGSVNVFLTGSSNQGAREGDQGGGSGGANSVSFEELLRYPVEALVVKHTAALTALAPPSLSTQIGATLDALKEHYSSPHYPSRCEGKGARTTLPDASSASALEVRTASTESATTVGRGVEGQRHSDAEYHLLLRDTKVQEERVFQLCCGGAAEKTQEAIVSRLSHGIGDPSVMSGGGEDAEGEADALLAQASELLHGSEEVNTPPCHSATTTKMAKSLVMRSSHFDCATSAAAEAYLALTRREQELLSRDEYDDYFDMAELLEDDEEEEGDAAIDGRNDLPKVLREALERAERCRVLAQSLAVEADKEEEEKDGKEKPVVEEQTDEEKVSQESIKKGEESSTSVEKEEGGDSSGRSAGATMGKVVSDKRELLRRELLASTLPTFFAFELEATHEEREALREWDRAAEALEAKTQALQQGMTIGGGPLSSADTLTATIPATASVQQTANITTKILESIASMDARDKDLERRARVHMKEALEAHKKSAAAAATAQAAQQRAAKGLIALHSFTERADALIPPVSEELIARRNISGAKSECTESTSAVVKDTIPATTTLTEESGLTTRAEAKDTLAKIQRAARRDTFLVQTEIREYRLMRAEEDLAEARVRHQEEALDSIQAALVQCVKDTDSGRDAIYDAQRDGFGDLVRKALRGQQLARQAVALREVQATAQLVSDVLVEYRMSASVLEAEQSAAWGKLLSQHQLDSYSAREKERQRVASMREAELARHTAHRAAYVAERAKRLDADWAAARLATVAATSTACATTFSHSESGLHSVGRGSANAPDVVASSSSSGPVQRLNALLVEVPRVMQWLREKEKRFGGVADALEECTQRSFGPPIGEQPRPVSSRVGYTASARSRPTSAQSNLSSATMLASCHGRSTVMGSEVVAGQHPEGSHNTVESHRLDRPLMMRLLTQLFALAQQDPRRCTQYFASVSFALEGLETIDLRSLATVEVSLSAPSDGAVEAAQRRWMEARGVSVCNLVTDLDLGSNHLTHITLVDLLCAFPQLQRLKLSDNKMVDLSFSEPDGSLGTLSRIPGRSSARRSITAAADNALAEALHVSELDISSNQLTTVEAIGTYLCLSLRRLTAHANQLASVQPLAGCRQLQYLFLNHNRISSVEGIASLPLLMELNLGHNDITSIDDIVEHTLLLQKLFISYNKLERFSNVSAHLMFLTQLFVNHNRLKTLDTRSCAAMPLLSVLHAEGNLLTDINGLASCPRLAIVKLSFNKLSTASSLRPLGACRGISSLDICGNPFLLHSNDESTVPNNDNPSAAERTRSTSSLPHAVRDVLLVLLPNLVELNNEKVDGTATNAKGGAAFPIRTQLCVLRWLRTGNGAGARSRNGACRIPPTLKHAAPLSGAYNAIFASLCFDDLAATLRNEAEVQHVYAARQLRAAEAAKTVLEERLSTIESDQQPPRHSSYVPAMHSCTAAIQKQGDRESLGVAATALKVFRACAESASALKPASSGHTTYNGDCLPLVNVNAHIRSAVYAARAREVAENAARQFLSARLYDYGLVRRAKAELEALRVAYRQSQAYKREQAARKIQPVWRGALLRTRLRRILHSRGVGDDDDAEFAKVEVDFEMPEDGNGHGGIGAILQEVMERQGPLPSFDVPTTMLPTVLKANSFATMSDVQAPVRVGSAPITQEYTQNQLSQSSRGRPASVQTDINATPRRTQQQVLEEEWGTSVAARIQKKNKKMALVHQKHVRQEFMKDPLNVKKELTGHSRRV